MPKMANIVNKGCRQYSFCYGERQFDVQMQTPTPFLERQAWQTKISLPSSFPQPYLLLLSAYLLFPNKFENNGDNFQTFFPKYYANYLSPYIILSPNLSLHLVIWFFFRLLEFPWVLIPRRSGPIFICILLSLIL